jgi:hypothetical protein
MMKPQFEIVLEAHIRKVGHEVIKEFQYNGNNYYEFVHDASKKLKL